MAKRAIPLTARQSAVLTYCGEFYAENDQLPSGPAIARHFGWSSFNSATEMMDALRRKGFVERNALGKYRFTASGRAYITAGAEVS